MVYPQRLKEIPALPTKALSSFKHWKEVTWKMNKSYTCKDKQRNKAQVLQKQSNMKSTTVMSLTSVYNFSAFCTPSLWPSDKPD